MRAAASFIEPVVMECASFISASARAPTRHKLFHTIFTRFLRLVHWAVRELPDHKIQPARKLEVTQPKGLLSGMKRYCLVHVLNHCCQHRTDC